MTFSIVHQLTKQAQEQKNSHLWDLAIMLAAMIQGKQNAKQ